MAERGVAIRTAGPRDVAALADVEQAGWPAGLAASAGTIARRVEVFAAGQWLATLDETIVGYASAQRISAATLEQQAGCYDTLTDSGSFVATHDAVGEIYLLVSVAVVPPARGRAIGRRLVDRQVREAGSLEGISRVVGFTRPAELSRFPGMSIDEYLARGTVDGRHPDPVLAFHLDAGARIVRGQAGFRPADGDACGCGVLIEYPAP